MGGKSSTGKNSGFFKIIILFVVLFSGLMPVYCQNANLVRQWNLESLEVKEVSGNNMVSLVDYEEAKGFLNCIFDEIDISTQNQCTVRRQDEVLKTKCYFTKDLFTINYNGEQFSYNYEFDGKLSLRGNVIRDNKKGEKVNYIITMQFITY